MTSTRGAGGAISTTRAAPADPAEMPPTMISESNAPCMARLIERLGNSFVIFIEWCLESIVEVPLGRESSNRGEMSVRGRTYGRFVITARAALKCSYTQMHAGTGAFLIANREVTVT